MVPTKMFTGHQLKVILRHDESATFIRSMYGLYTLFTAVKRVLDLGEETS